MDGKRKPGAEARGRGDGKKSRMYLYFPADVAERVKRVSKVRRMAFSALVEEYVSDALTRDEKKHAAKLKTLQARDEAPEEYTTKIDS